MLLQNNEGIKPVRFPVDYCASIFEPTHQDFHHFVKMSFASKIADDVELPELQEQDEENSSFCDEDDEVVATFGDVETRFEKHSQGTDFNMFLVFLLQYLLLSSRD